MDPITGLPDPITWLPDSSGDGFEIMQEAKKYKIDPMVPNIVLF